MKTKIEEPKVPEHDKLRALKGKNQGLGYWIENCGFQSEKALEKILMAIVYMTDGKEEQGTRPTRKDLIKFLNWYMPYKKAHQRKYGIPARIDKILGDYFGIDREKLEKEKVALLDYVRKCNDAH